jgi:hypothetical protein
VNAPNKTPLVDPQEGQPEKSIEQQIAVLDAEPCPDQQQDEVPNTTEVHG